MTVRKASYLQIPDGSAFLTIQGCSMILWRESLFEESLTRSCTKFNLFQLGNGYWYQQLLEFYLPPPNIKNKIMVKLTRVMRCLASAEVWGAEGKFRSTFIILYKNSSYHSLGFSSCYGITWVEAYKTLIHTFWTYPFDFLPQREEYHRGTHSKECPESSCQLHNHEVCSPPFLVLNNLKFHTWSVSCFWTVRTIQSLQFSVDPTKI